MHNHRSDGLGRVHRSHYLTNYCSTNSHRQYSTVRGSAAEGRAQHHGARTKSELAVHVTGHTNPSAQQSVECDNGSGTELSTDMVQWQTITRNVS